MQNFVTFFEFENGVIIDGDTKTATVRSILEPIIFHRRLSGKIRIECLNEKISIGYDDVKSFEYVPELMQAICKHSSSSEEDFG